MDTRATSHIHANKGILHFSCSSRNICYVMVGYGSSINVTKTGSSAPYTVDPYRTVLLHNIFITGNITKHLVSMFKVTRVNDHSIEFDAFDFSVKEFKTKQVLSPM